jgi:hypothetical protein
VLEQLGRAVADGIKKLADVNNDTATWTHHFPRGAHENDNG